MTEEIKDFVELTICPSCRFEGPFRVKGYCTIEVWSDDGEEPQYGAFKFTNTATAYCPECTLEDKLEAFGFKDSLPNTKDMTLKELREAGYACVVFNPEELRGAAPRDVEEALVERGWDTIDDLHPDNEGTCTHLLVGDGYGLCQNSDSYHDHDEVTTEDCARCPEHTKW